MISGILCYSRVVAARMADGCTDICDSCSDTVSLSSSHTGMCHCALASETHPALRVDLHLCHLYYGWIGQ